MILLIFIVLIGVTDADHNEQQHHFRIERDAILIRENGFIEHAMSCQVISAPQVSRECNIISISCIKNGDYFGDYLQCILITQTYTLSIGMEEVISGSHYHRAEGNIEDIGLLYSRDINVVLVCGFTQYNVNYKECKVYYNISLKRYTIVEVIIRLFWRLRIFL
jgi:hypothetical protein